MDTLCVQRVLSFTILSTETDVYVLKTRRCAVFENYECFNSSLWDLVANQVSTSGKGITLVFEIVICILELFPVKQCFALINVTFLSCFYRYKYRVYCYTYCLFRYVYFFLLECARREFEAR